MKKLFVLVFAISLAGIANAQYYVGGNVGITTNSSKTEVGSTTSGETSDFGFTLAPRVGYQWSEKISFGAEVALGISTSKDKLTNVSSSTTNWRITPFARYMLLEYGKFSVNAEGSLGIRGSSSSNTAGNITAKGTSTFGFGLNVVPVLSYTFNNKISFETRLNFMNFGYNVTKSTTPAVGDDIITNTSRFNIGADAGDVINLGNFTVGFIYKF